MLIDSLNAQAKQGPKRPAPAAIRSHALAKPNYQFEKRQRDLKKKQKQEGIKIAVETIQKLKTMKGVRGVHIMAIEWEEAVPEIVKQAKLK